MTICPSVQNNVILLYTSIVSIIKLKLITTPSVQNDMSYCSIQTYSSQLNLSFLSHLLAPVLVRNWIQDVSKSYSIVLGDILTLTFPSLIHQDKLMNLHVPKTLTPLYKHVMTNNTHELYHWISTLVHISCYCLKFLKQKSKVTHTIEKPFNSNNIYLKLWFVILHSMIRLSFHILSVCFSSYVHIIHVTLSYILCAEWISPQLIMPLFSNMC